MKRRFLAGLALFALAACGDLPQPFRGNPGGMAGRLVVPPPYRVAVPVPEAAMLTGTESEAFARAIAQALLKREVPAVAEDPLPLDWRLKVDARLEGNRVVPRYALFDPDGAPQGVAEGSAIPARDWSRPNAALLADVANDASRRAAELLLRAEAARRKWRMVRASPLMGVSMSYQWGGVCKGWKSFGLSPAVMGRNWAACCR
jgi:hypothetical protein